MTQTLITITTDQLLSAAAFRPGHIQILQGSTSGELLLHEIVPPEEEPSGSFNSDSFDVENKYKSCE